MTAVSRGIIYIVTGEKYVEEAGRSAASVRKHSPELPMTMISDRRSASALFDQHLPIENPQHGPLDKVRHIHHSPYEETLYLDSDTCAGGDISPVFELMKRFDMAAALSPYRAQYRVPEVPEVYPEINSGVMLFRRNARTDSLFSLWLKHYQADCSRPVEWLLPGGAVQYRKAIPNQPALRRAMYESNVRVATLPPEYNCRLNFPGALHTAVKILHGRADSMEQTVEKLNKNTLPRIHLMRWGKLKVLDSAMPADENFVARLRWSLHQNGPVRTLASMLRAIFHWRSSKS